MCAYTHPVYCQRLKVTQTDSSRGLPPIQYGRQNGHASIIIESAVENLDVSTTTYDSIIKKHTSRGFMYTIDVNVDSLRNSGDDFLRRVVLLSSPLSSETQLIVPSDNKEDLREAAYYYTVTLPEKFPKTLSIEWLVNTHSQKGIRISYGGRYGFFVGGTLGKFRPSGDNINDVVRDCDLSYAKTCGYICTTIVGGFRMGLIHRNLCTAYMYVGAGYGEYGKQWENKVKLENSRYFYSDYIKGVAVDCGASVSLSNMYFSFGENSILQQGKFMLSWQLGFGLSFNASKWFKIRLK